MGRALHSNSGPTWIGELLGGASTRVAEMAARLTKVGLPTMASDNIMGVVWSKFVHNCAINPISAITGLRPGEIARDRRPPICLHGCLTKFSPWWSAPASGCTNTTRA